MKNNLFALLLSFFFFACDDGKIEVASFDFDNTNLKSCNEAVPNGFFLYTYKDKRAIIIKIPETNFENQLVNMVPPIVIDGNNQVLYREYAQNIANDNICGFPTNVSIPLQKEWKGVGGFIKIETNIAKTEPTSTGATSFDTYNHKITLVNPSFDNGNGGQQKSDFIFLGNYTKPNLNKLVDFTPNLVLRKCALNNNFFKVSNRQSIVLNVENTIFNTAILDTPKTRIINGTNNIFVFRIHNNSQLDSNFCNTSFDANAISDTWTARSGGIIEVVTTSIPGTTPVQYNHAVRLINVELVKGDLFFNLGNSYLLGNFQQ